MPSTREEPYSLIERHNMATHTDTRKSKLAVCTTAGVDAPLSLMLLAPCCCTQDPSGVSKTHNTTVLQQFRLCPCIATAQRLHEPPVLLWQTTAHWQGTMAELSDSKAAQCHMAMLATADSTQQALKRYQTTQTCMQCKPRNTRNASHRRAVSPCQQPSAVVVVVGAAGASF